MMAVLRIFLLVVMPLIVLSYAMDDSENDIPGYELEDLTRQTQSDTKERLNRLSGRLIALNNQLKSYANNVTALKNQIKPDVYFHALYVRNNAPGVGDTLVFKDVKRNSFDAYNYNTGTFTAPVEGLYWFAAYICNESHKWLVFHIMVNNEKMTVGLAADSYPNCNSANMVTKLDHGDKVYVRVGNKYGGKVIHEDADRACMFTGALIN